MPNLIAGAGNGAAAQTTTAQTQIAAAKLRSIFDEASLAVPTLHFVLGSGLGSVLEDAAPPNWTLAADIKFTDLPGLADATVVGHRGAYKIFRQAETAATITFQTGRLHGYEGHTAQQTVQTVMIPRLAGTETFILTNAAGSLDPSYEVGSVMLIQDHVNLTGQNPLTGPNPTRDNAQPLGPRFPDMTNAYDPTLRATLKTALTEADLKTQQGIYLGLLGPSFETPAEIALFSRWGLHAVGMSTVWEAIALKHSGAKLAGLSLISNAGCGLSTAHNDNAPRTLVHEEILRESAKAAMKIIRGLFLFAEKELKKL